jgi:WD40 repeat protein
MTRPSNNPVLIACLTYVLASLFLGAGRLAFASIFGMNKNEVVEKVAKLPETYSDVIVRGVDFSPDGNRLAVDSDGGKINIWDWRHERIVRTIQKPHGAEDGLTTNPLQFSLDGRLFAACVGKGEGGVVVRVWNTVDWTVARDIIDTGPGACNAMQLTPDGKFLLYVINRAVRPSELVVYMVSNWERTWSIDLALHPVSVAANPKGDLISIGGIVSVFPRDVLDPVKRIQQMRSVPTIDIVDLEQRKIVRTMEGVAMGPIAWSPDGTRIAVVGRLKVEMFDTQSGRSILSEYGEDTDVRFTNDGRFFIESDHNETGHGSGLKIWDHWRQQLLQKIAGDIGSIAVCRDGKYLAVGEAGRTTIWQFK